LVEGLHIASSIEAALIGMARGYRPMWTVTSAAVANFPELPGVEVTIIDNEGISMPRPPKQRTPQPVMKGLRRWILVSASHLRK
jgi:hypothetical protein